MGEFDGLLAADDDAVRTALGQELKRMKGAAEPGVALGIDPDASADQVRARFLALVKVYHPNRFARRPADIIKLANEVFLLLRRAHQRVGERASASASASAGTGTSTPQPTTAAAAAVALVVARASEVSPPSQPKLDVDAALAARRRRPRSNQASTSSSPPPSAVQVLQRARRRETEQKERFQTAMDDLGNGRLTDARTALRALVAETPSDRRYRAYLHYANGRLHETAGRAAEALAEYDRALGFDPDLEIARGSREMLGGGRPEGGGGAGRFGRWFRK